MENEVDNILYNKAQINHYKDVLSIFNLFILPIVAMKNQKSYISIFLSHIFIVLTGISCSSEDNNGGKVISDFYDEYIIRKEKEIIDLMNGYGQNGDSFVFITDTHWESNRGYSPSLIKHILENTGITKVFHGGDIIHGSYQDNTSYALDFMNKMSFTTLFPVFGNHEQFIKVENNLDGTIYPTSNNEIYSIFFKHLENTVDIGGRFYYYLDNESQKIRYFFMDSHWPEEPDIRGMYLNYSEQLSWLEQKCSEIGHEWSIVVLQHIVFSGTVFSDESEPNEEPKVESVGKSVLGKQLISKLDELYDIPNMPQIIAVISGHTHYTYHEYSKKGYPIIASTDDGTWGYKKIDGKWVDVNFSIYRPDDSVNAQSFDVYTIDKANKTIHATRIGYGKNRRFTF